MTSSIRLNRLADMIDETINILEYDLGCGKDHQDDPILLEE